MTTASDEQLIDGIYGAIADPEAWNDVLRGFCDRAGAFTASITARLDRRAAVTTALPGARESAREYSDYWCTQDPVIEAAHRLSEGFIARARGLAPDFEHTAFYNGHARKFDRCDTLILNTFKRGTDRCQILISRDHAAGPYDPAIEESFAVFRPHLVRAARIARRHDEIGLKHSLALGALDRLSIGVVLVRLDRSVFENRVATDLMRAGRGLTIRKGRLRATDHRLQDRLDRIIRTATLDGKAGELVLPGPEDGPAILLTAIPLNTGTMADAAQGYHPFLAPGAMVTLAMPGTRTDALPAARLMALFGLTETEALIAQCLHKGMSLEEAARAGSMGVSTARWHLKNIFGKTETRRQGELVARLSRLAVPLREPPPNRGGGPCRAALPSRELSCRGHRGGRRDMYLYDSFGMNPRTIRFFLAEKGIDLPRIDVDILGAENRQADFLKKNPSGQTPVLVLMDGTPLAETYAICEYLEDIHPAPALIGTTREEKAVTRMWWRRVELNICHPMVQGFYYSDGYDLFKDRIHCIPGAAEDLKEKARRAMAWLDGAMGTGPFIAGDRFTVADICLFCYIDQLRSVGQPIPANLRALQAWFDRVAQRDAAETSVWKEQPMGMRG